MELIEKKNSTWELIDLLRGVTQLEMDSQNQI